MYFVTVLEKANRPNFLKSKKALAFALISAKKNSAIDRIVGVFFHKVFSKVVALLNRWVAHNKFPFPFSSANALNWYLPSIRLRIGL